MLLIQNARKDSLVTRRSWTVLLKTSLCAGIGAMSHSGRRHRASTPEKARDALYQTVLIWNNGRHLSYSSNCHKLLNDIESSRTVLKKSCSNWNCILKLFVPFSHDGCTVAAKQGRVFKW